MSQEEISQRWTIGLILLMATLVAYAGATPALFAYWTLGWALLCVYRYWEAGRR